ncbi:hypothetical protein [Nocardia seriolae]|uniref:Protein kinase domain-containing protein n=1 Tax=Nocardia seriolae TaxID=37332 RepID=A0ABC8B1I3_9NOCA|nr:hypothetical protein [Nocardia seriolae]APB00177.1 hypothetical protein NS506_06140 [Nocardia seriolae]MTJ64853.1 hypothetical protein [Nocardia seriolae]MTJ76480.1 hypothetical protein [Nocardia seriolae]MTK50250.1 hypothetical protein [Nocardia seriolae]MTL15221.1 hypothetical protein [Nocardia seriolae]
MTSTQPRTVDRAALALGRRLGQGGQGAVYEVTNRTFTVAPGIAWEVVFKEYDAALLPSLDAAALGAMVDLLFGLSSAEGAWLCERAAWPAAVVEDQGRVCGFLMRAVPDSFRFELRSLSGAATTSKRLANFEYLLNDDAYIAGIGLTVSDSDRLALLADLSATLTRLHRLGIVVGDLSPKNLLFRTQPEAGCFLLDCDAMRLHGRSVLPQAATPDWQLPAGEEKATRPGDIYKLGLLAARLFERNQTSKDPGALTTVSATLGGLAQASFDAEPARRPSPSQWTELLTVTIPTVRIARPAGQQQPRVRPPWQPPATSNQTTPALVSSPVLLGIAVVVIVVLVVVLLSTRSHSSNSASRTAGSTVAGQNGYSTTYTYQTTTRSPVSRVGIVDLAPGLAGDSRAIAVATTLNTYFNAINSKNYDGAIDELDPSLRGNRDVFAEAWATTTDRDIQVLEVNPGPTARVTFQSLQAAGQGPKGIEWATCVNWDLLYRFSQPGSEYLIAHSTSVNGPTPC